MKKIEEQYEDNETNNIDDEIKDKIKIILKTY